MHEAPGLAMIWGPGTSGELAVTNPTRRYAFSCRYAFPARYALSLVLSGLLLLPGCGWPRVHKVLVQQGNVITQGMIDKLKPGMTRTQVAYIMGEPVVRNTFNDTRWDYVYSLENPGQYEVNSTVSLFFENERLSHFVGDLAPTSAKPASDDDEPAEEAAG